LTRRSWDGGCAWRELNHEETKRGEMHATGMNKAGRFLFGAIAFAAAAIGGWKIVDSFQTANAVAEQSAQAALMDEAARFVDAYQKQHGEYPASLESMKWTYPDGGDASTLATLRYESDGATYSLKAKGAYGHEIVTGSDVGGRIIFR
jgi:hypothetical protein